MRYCFLFIVFFVCNFNLILGNDYIVKSYDNHNLHGTLIESESLNSTLAVIIAGSGPTDRDGNNVNIKGNYLMMLAEGLNENGISTFRYDKRGVGKSLGDITSPDEIKFTDYINDAISIINHFRETKKYKRITVIGHSEGALIGMIASRSIVNSFISIAGAGEDYLTLIERQLSIQPEYIKSMSTPILKQLKNKKLVDSVPPLLNSLFRSDVQVFLIDASSYLPVVEISKLDIPVLIIQGTHDIQIDVDDAIKLDVAAKNSQLELIEGMNHVFRQASENRLLNIQTYGNPNSPIDNNMVDIVSEFIKNKT